MKLILAVWNTFKKLSLQEVQKLPIKKHDKKYWFDALYVEPSN